MLADLIKRVEEGEGADRELDGAIVRALSGSKELWFPFFGRFMTEQTAPVLTDSLDAVVALIEDKLPGWVAAGDLTGGAYCMEIVPPIGVPGGGFHCAASSPARALLAAALKAIEETRR